MAERPGLAGQPAPRPAGTGVGLGTQGGLEAAGQGQGPAGSCFCGYLPLATPSLGGWPFLPASWGLRSACPSFYKPSTAPAPSLRGQGWSHPGGMHRLCPARWRSRPGSPPDFPQQLLTQ